MPFSALVSFLRVHQSLGGFLGKIGRVAHKGTLKYVTHPLISLTWRIAICIVYKKHIRFSGQRQQVTYESFETIKRKP
jgi:hypothetical protein